MCAFAAVGSQLNGRLSPIRIGFAGIIALAALYGILTCLKPDKFRGGLALYWIGALAALLLLILLALSVENETLGRVLAYIRQAIPFLCFIVSGGLLTALFFRKEIGEILRAQRFVFGAVLILICALLLMGAFLPLRANYYPSHDYAIFSYFGQQILKGKIPYRDLWDHKPPVIFYLNALGLSLTRGSLLGIWILEVLFLFVGALIFFRILRKRFSESLSLCVTALGILHYVRVFDFGNYCEEFSLFFLLCAMGLWFLRKRGKRNAFALGLLCGLAFTCKQNTIGGWCAFLCMEGIRCLKSGEWKPFLKRFAAAAGGFLLVNLIWAGYFAANGALADYWDVAFRFNLIYSESGAENRLACAWTTLTFLPSVTPFLLAAFLCWPICLRSRKAEPLTQWALCALPIELVFAGLSGMNYQHYFILCIPAACVLLTAGTEMLSGKLPKWALCVLLIAGTLPLIRLYRENYAPRFPSAYTKARDYLLENTAPEDPVLVWGSRSAIYVMSERSAPTSYFNERPLYLFADKVETRQWDRFLSDLQADPPLKIIYTHDTALPFVRRENGECIFPSHAEYAQETYAWLCDHYKYETTINKDANDAWDVFSRQ